MPPRRRQHWFPQLFAAAVVVAGLMPAAASGPQIERVTTRAPYPRGLVMLDDGLYVLCRGRVRSREAGGGVSAAVEDQAGTIYRVDPDVTEPLGAPLGERVRANGDVVAHPTDPPFRLWDRTARPPAADRRTDRPYCTLRYHAPTDSFYLCAFSGIDQQRTERDPVAFSKNETDALLRYDRRTERWYEVERHRPGAPYPHDDGGPPPHGWLAGPDNCLPVGRLLYAVAKDNSLLVRYDLSALEEDPEAGPPAGTVVIGADIDVRGLGRRRYEGHSMLAERDGWLYVGYRTSSVIVRIELSADGTPVEPVVAELVARFDPYDPATGHSANLTDMGFDDTGRLYVVSAMPARIHRFTPDPDRVFDARGGRTAPWCDLAAATGQPTKSENVLYHDGWLYVTSGDGYAYQEGARGTVYRVRVSGATP